MVIQIEDQKLRQLCELARFIDSGYQSFVEQVTGLPARKVTEAAFFSGAALALKLVEHFKEPGYSPSDNDFLISLLAEEINAFMEKNDMRLEWEPHVPLELKR